MHKIAAILDEAAQKIERLTSIRPNGAGPRASPRGAASAPFLFGRQVEEIASSRTRPMANHSRRRATGGHARTRPKCRDFGRRLLVTDNVPDARADPVPRPS